MGITILAIPHCAKRTGLAHRPLELQANPGLSEEGCLQAHKMATALAMMVASQKSVESIIFCGNMVRVLETASIVATRLCFDLLVDTGLTIPGNNDLGRVIMLPGCEKETIATCKAQAANTLTMIGATIGDGKTAIAITHHPIILGLMAYCRGITDIAGIQKFEEEHKTALVKSI